MTDRTVRRNFGWIRDTPDVRDHMYAPSFLTTESLKGTVPSKFDMRSQVTDIPIYNQGSLGSCTSNSISFLYQFVEKKQRNTVVFPPSRLFLYYNVRSDKNSDTGASVRNCIKSAAATGMCSEGLWPYDTSKFKDKPTQICYDQAANAKVIEYVSVPINIDTIKMALAEGNPIAFGFDVYSSFDYVGFDGRMPIPDTGKEKITGGHCVCMMGYDDDITFSGGHKGGFIVRNSWGTFWGDGGYFYMPYCVGTNSAIVSNFWIIKAITNPAVVVNPPVPDPPCCCKCVIS